VLLQGEMHDAAENFDMYQILQRQHTCGFSATAIFLLVFVCRLQ